MRKVFVIISCFLGFILLSFVVEMDTWLIGIALFLFMFLIFFFLRCRSLVLSMVGMMLSWVLLFMGVLFPLGSNFLWNGSRELIVPKIEHEFLPNTLWVSNLDISWKDMGMYDYVKISPKRVNAVEYLSGFYNMGISYDWNVYADTGMIDIDTLEYLYDTEQGSKTYEYLVIDEYIYRLPIGVVFIDGIDYVLTYKDSSLERITIGDKEYDCYTVCSILRK